MAQKKSVKKDDNRNEKKLSAKSKHVIRKSIGGVLLASALIVAAIPAGGSGMAQAAAVNNNPAMDYSADSAYGRNGEFTLDNASVLDSTGRDVYSSFEIRQVNGRDTLVWKYKYFIPPEGISGSTVGVICGYNDSYSVDTLNLSGRLYTGYDVIAKSAYDSFWGTHSTDDFSVTSNLPNEADRAELERYFIDNTRYTTWIAKYNAARQAYIDENGVEPATLADINMATDTLNLVAGDMTSDKQKLYYCDQNGRRGYTLKEIANFSQGQTYRGDDGTPKTIPDESNIYIVILNNASDITTAGTKYDEFGYKYIDAQDIGGIGKNAFKDTKLVNNLVVADGITLIGDSAFENSYINVVQFASVTYIGNYVFKDCEYLTAVNLVDQTECIGKEAFRGCTQLTSISIPKSCKDIGFGAFADCTALDTVSFANSLGCTVGEYAFFNCPNISSVTFPSTNAFSIGKAAFAMDAGLGTNCKLTEFDFPENLGDYVSKTFTSANQDESYSYTNGYQLKDENDTTYSSGLGDYLFANRYNLNTVVMPLNFGTAVGDLDRVPMNTFDGCKDVGLLKFADAANMYAYYDSNLFEDVENEELYVYGPSNKNNVTPGEYNDKTFANPRYSTWYASTKTLDYVPYVYNDGTTDHYEVGIGKYRYELSVNDDGTAQLISCKFIDDPEEIDLTIPSQVAKYNISDMASGCLDEVKNYINELTIPDGSIEKIDDSVFQSSAILKKVYIGDSLKEMGDNAFADCPQLEYVLMGPNIETIGSQAFYDCPVLEHIDFAVPGNSATLSDIGANAFYTGGSKLYFKGLVEDGYAPFEYAMGPDKINGDSVRICYESPSPQNLKCIMDEMTGLVTLIDYPHYTDVDADIRTKYQSGQALNDEEQAIIDSTLYITLPEAIESIDVKSFLANDASNTNKKDWIYVPAVADDLDTAYTKQAVYGDNNLKDAANNLYTDVYAENGGYTAGLFSGQMNETTPLNAVGDTTHEQLVKGNDWILSIAMPGVKALPDYAFDSCERLQSVIIGDNCETIGTSAFQGCTSLTAIGTNNNPNYTFDNYILYENKDDGTLEINTCLPARGTNRSSSEIWVDTANDPNLANVSSMKSGAFSGCEYITKADLSDTTISSLPNKAFDGCKTLTEVKLPDTIRSIATQAFDNGSPSLDVTIPADSNISDTAFDKDATVTIWTYPECTVTAAYEAANNDEVYIKYLDSEFIITFLNDDLTVYEKISVLAGYNGYYPDNDPTPKLPSNAGNEFSYWYFDNSNGIKNVTENRQAIAVFVPKSTNPTPSSGPTPSGASPAPSGASPAPSGATPTPSGGGGSQSQNSISNNTAYSVVVENGAGSGQYRPGTVVTITAYSAPAGKVFDKWTTSNTNISFSNAQSASATFIMPSGNVKVTATYKSSTSGNSASNNKTNNNNNNNNNNNGGNNNGGNSASGNKSGGTVVNVTTETIDNNNKNLAYATVAGSTDNFVVKVTDSAVASAQVEAALKAKYGDDFENIKYVAFDISLYDSTGTYLVANSENLAVTITLPIPDDLVSYAGNNKAAAVINGQIDDKAVKFTTIDGVPCMTFTATHFSPYTIYVDTQNLTAGVTDMTPKTGVPAPKWFLSAGLALFGIMLFLWKDKKVLPGTSNPS